MSEKTLVGGKGPTLFRFVDAPEHGAKPFVRLGDEVVTYGQLRDVMARTACLFAELGIQRGDRIVICSEHELEVIALYLAAMRAGVTPALIDPGSAVEEANALVRAAHAMALFADERLLRDERFQAVLLPGGHKLPMAPGGLDARRQTAADATSYPALLSRLDAGYPLPPTISGDTSAFILFTSGTTSRPKGVEATHRAVTAHMRTMHAQYGYGQGSVVINGLPLHHSDGINHGPVNIMAAGGTLLRTGAFSIQQLPRILGLVRSQQATHMITVPTVLALISRMGDEFTASFRSPSFRFISSTAGPLDEQLWRSFEQRFGTMVVNSYGLTETICEGFYCGPTTETRRIGTIGKPIDIDVRIIDSEGGEVPCGAMGELVLRGSCVMKGYFNAPEETATVLRDGWLYTGDLAVRDSDGFFTITGRKKNVIITGGINVYPEDVSRTIMRMPGVLDVATVGVPDSTFGERVVSCVVADRLGGPDPEQVIEHCRQHMSREKVPSQVFLLDELPRGASGKVALPQVRAIVAERVAQEAQHRSPVDGSGDDVVRRVVELASRSFKTPVSELSADSEPETTVGWNSLAHMDFLLSLESAFELRIGPADMLSIVTLGDAIEFVRGATATTQP
jgi:long-chain acyl-CoA synthetase